MIFLDSNIWIYGYEVGQSIKQRTAVELASTPEVCLSSQVVNEIARNLLRLKRADENVLREIIEDLYSDYLVLDVGKDDILLASDLRKAYAFSYWDALIVATSIRANATILYSEDMQNGLKVMNRLTIVNPF